MHAVRHRFSPEFVNRIDCVITYEPLSSDSLSKILDLQLTELQRGIHRRMGVRGFDLEISRGGRQLLIRAGTSEQYGARELKRTIHRKLIQPLALLVSKGKVGPGDTVRIEVGEDPDELRFRVRRTTLEELRPAC